MSNAITTTTNTQAEIMERVLVVGDLSQLTPQERIRYYTEVCKSLGLNPLTKPFDYINLSDKKDETKLVLYAKRDATDQLRDIKGVSVEIVSREIVDGIYIVTARATDSTGRVDTSIGAVALVKEGGDWKEGSNGRRYFSPDGTFKPLTPDAKANAMMKAETKAKRRVTLSICGLGWLDETELETIPNAKPVVIADTGEIVTDTQKTILPQDWKAQVTALGVKSGAFIKGADIGLAADISAAQSAARDLLNKNGNATKAEFDTVTADLQSVIDRAEAILEKDAIPA